MKTRLQRREVLKSAAAISALSIMVDLSSPKAEVDSDSSLVTGVPADIEAVFQKSMYMNSIWGLRVVELDTGRALIDLEPEYKFFIGSVRKIFTVGELLDQI